MYDPQGLNQHKVNCHAAMIPCSAFCEYVHTGADLLLRGVTSHSSREQRANPRLKNITRLASCLQGMNRQKDRKTERQKDRKTDRQTDRKAERQKERKTERQKDRKTDRQTDRKTERQKDRKTERQTDRQTERQKDRKKERKKGTTHITRTSDSCASIRSVPALFGGHSSSSHSSGQSTADLELTLRAREGEASPTSSPSTKQTS